MRRTIPPDQAPPPPLQRFLRRLLQLLLLGLGAVVVLRFLLSETFIGGAVGSFADTLLLPSWLALPVAIGLRARREGRLAALFCLLHLALVLPLHRGAETPPAARALRVLSANLLMVHPDPEAVVPLYLAQEADVWVLQEYSPRWEAAFARAQIPALFPNGIAQVQEDSFGIALFSRLPLVDSGIGDLEGVPFAWARLLLPSPTDGLPPQVVELVAVHTLPPRTAAYHQAWRTQLTAIQALAASRYGAMILAGDLNLSPVSAAWQQITSGDMRGAHEACGRGAAVTFPNGIFPLPSARFDHVLLSPELGCVAIRELAGTGSDHSAVVADLGWLREP